MTGDTLHHRSVPQTTTILKTNTISINNFNLKQTPNHPPANRHRWSFANASFLQWTTEDAIDVFKYHPIPCFFAVSLLFFMGVEYTLRMIPSSSPPFDIGFIATGYLHRVLVDSPTLNTVLAGLNTEGYGYYDEAASNYLGQFGSNYGGNDGGDDGGDNGGDSSGDNDGSGSGKRGLYDTNQVFSSREELVDWATNVGRENGFVIVTKRSKRNSNGLVVKIWLKCDRGGVYKGAPTLRKSGTKKTNCQFELQGKYQMQRDGWIIVVVDDTHNHEPAEHLKGHAYAMRLTENELSTVKKLSEQNIDPRNILGTLREQNPNNVSGLRTVYNARAKIKKSTRIGETPMQVFFSILQQHQYIYTPHIEEPTNTVDGVFFIHLTSHTLWRAYPHVLMIDTTYKTNLYKMPFVQMVGVTSTLKSFSVAHAFIDYEREANFRWVLEQLKATLEDKCMEPRVILTDRDLALMNASEEVFPSAVRLLCRWHISENIVKHCKASFSNEEWGAFQHVWSVLINSETEDIYAYNYDRLYRRLVSKHSRVLMYLKNNWLDPYKERFVSAWINRSYNFGQHTTNRVESQHSLLKSYLKATNSTLDRFIPFINNILATQEIAIKESFTKSKIMIMVQHNHEVIKLLRGNVSIAALDMLVGEINRINHLLISKESCGCHLFTSCGLPCACKLNNYFQTGQRIPLDAIDVFWRKLDFSPAYIVREVQVDVHKEMEMVTKHLLVQPENVKRSLINIFKSFVTPSKTDKKPPKVQTHTRGRPKKDKQKETILDPPRHSSYVQPGEKFDGPPTYSSSVVKSKQGPLHRSQSMSSKSRGKDGLSQQSSKFSYIPGDEDKNILFRFNRWIPSFFFPYISGADDVLADGNCGFRAIALALGYGENHWRFIRTELIAELDENRHRYVAMFPDINEIRESLNWNGLGAAPHKNWMTVPPATILIANRFRVVIILISIGNSATFFPFWLSPRDISEHIISIAYVQDCHFIRIRLVSDYPMPVPSKYWYLYKTENANDWEAIYGSRIQKYLELRPVDPVERIDLV